MPGIPSVDECRALHREFGADAKLVAHMEAVAALGALVAKELRSRGHMVDVALVTAGCLLHDIGRSRTHGVSHGYMGGKLLAEKGYPASLVRAVERHVGGGLDAPEAAKNGLPLQDYNPVTLEEKLVCHIDNLFDGAKRQPVAAELAYLEAQKLPHAAAKVKRLHEEIGRLLGVDLDRFGG